MLLKYFCLSGIYAYFVYDRFFKIKVANLTDGKQAVYFYAILLR